LVKIGDWIKIRNQDGQYTEWASKKWQITDIAQSVEDHPGYDMGVYPQKLISCADLPVSLYEWEFYVTTSPNRVRQLRLKRRKHAAIRL
jgi:hypothetical protein